MQKDYKDWDAEINGLYLEINPCFCRSILSEVTSFFLIPVANSFWCSALLARQLDAGKLRKLRPAFKEGGTVTAGNSSGIRYHLLPDVSSLHLICKLGTACRSHNAMYVMQFSYVQYPVDVKSTWININCIRSGYSAIMDQVAIHQLRWPIITEYPLLFLCHRVQKISLHVIPGRQMLTWLLVDFPHSDIPFAYWFGMELALCLLPAFGNGNSRW